MPKLKKLFLTPLDHYLVFICLIFIIKTITLNTSFAIAELDLLEEFGVEVFQTDPVRQAEIKAQQKKEKEAALPPHISPETLAIDQELDAIDLNTPTEPKWEPVEYEISLTGLKSQECCLRAIRSSRYEVEARCKAMNKHIWHIESIPVIYNEEVPLKEHKLCKVYHNDITKEELKKAVSENQDAPPPQPDFYRCRARSIAKCFNPDGENAIFVHQ